ncbi:MAG: type II toxin-antitoxin system HicB family antitoxin [bacterium]
MKRLTYRIVLREEPEGGYTVTVPSLPGCITYGENIKEAYLMAEDAIMAYIESQRKHGELITDDSRTFEGVLNLEYA